MGTIINHFKLILLFATVFAYNVAAAQFDGPSRVKGSNGGLILPPNDPYLKNNNKLLSPNNDLNSPNYISSKSGSLPTQSDRKKDVQVMNPKVMQMIEGDKRIDVLYKTFQRDQDLGDITTKSGSIRISCRDHEYVDGDLIRIYFNNTVVVQQLELKGSFTSLELKLVDGMNVIEFEALNDGLSAPNTAELKITDDKGTELCTKEWNVAARYRASVLVVKKPL